MSIYDAFLVSSVNFIVLLQSVFKGQHELMLLLSHIGDPHKAFTLLFPIAFHMHDSVGVRVVWVAAISEWMNAILKWLVYGDRPYWWVQEATVYAARNRPHLDQFKLTCETGPGSPSGHAMVSSSAVYVVASALIFYKFSNSRVKSSLVWLAFSVYVILVSVSRCFIAAHFPHQVVIGAINGILLAHACNMISMHALSWKYYIYASVIMLISGAGLFYVFDWLGLEPLWSIGKAMKWCANPKWIHKESTLFYALVRDCACVLGLGLAFECRSLLSMVQRPCSYLSSVLKAAVSIAIFSCIDHLPLIKHPSYLFYLLAFVKFSILPFIVVITVPFLFSLFNGCISRGESHNKQT